MALESLIPAEWSRQVAAAPGPEFWFGTVLVIGVAAAALYGVFRFIHRARIIEDTPTSKVRSAHQGYVELIGRGELMAGTPIIAPLTGSHCTWYRFKVEKRERTTDSRGHSRTRWRTVRSGVSDELFLLRDDTGTCIIDPDGAEVTPSKKDAWYGNSGDWGGGMPRKTSGFAGLAGGSYRYTEERMQAGDSLYAIGLFRTVGGSSEAPNTARDIRELLRSWKQDQQTLVERFDHNGDGMVDASEWDSARREARREVKQMQKEHSVQPVHNLLGHPSDGRRPYILSVLPQDQIARRYRWASVGSLTAFILLGSIGSWLLTVRFGA